LERQVIIDDKSSLLSQTRRLLHQHGLHARKGLGQHFLIDPEALRLSIEAATLTSNDTVVEIGPGLGILTEALAQRVKRVIAVEVDTRISSMLSERFSENPVVTILNADVLAFDPKAVLKEDITYKVVANLPYYIAAPILRRFLEAEAKPQRMVVMVQKEVAESIVAKPGQMSLMSVSVQLYSKPSIVSYVPAKSFYPPPKVDSAVMAIDVYHQPVVAVDVPRFFEVVRAGFSAPRKQLRNSLAQGLSIPLDISSQVLISSEISPQRRAQTLSLEEWAVLARTIGEKGIS